MIVCCYCVCKVRGYYHGAQKNSDTHAIYIDYCTNSFFFQAVVIITNQVFTAALEVAGSCWVGVEAWQGENL